MMQKVTNVQDYEAVVGAATIERLLNKAKPLEDRYVVNVNATYYGGGVAELLSSSALLMNSMGINTEWKVLRGYPDYFDLTKSMHNALQSGPMNFAEFDKQLYEGVVQENARRMFMDDAIVVIHDPQPLPMIHFMPRRTGPWIWRCHIDLSQPHPELWNYMAPFVEQYDAVIMSIPEYAQKLNAPQVFFMPAIDPFTDKNRRMSDVEMDAALKEYNIPTDLPLITQVSRFDPWKDPHGVIEAFKLARKEVDCTLVLLGNFAADDPEGVGIFESLLEHQEERILILPKGDDIRLVNSLQTRADIVLQKSLREGFGLTVTEAMWKGTPVIGGNVGGIRYQIKDGENGYLVSSVEETAQRIVTLLKDEKLRQQMGYNARESVRERFLMTRYLEQYVDLFNAFERKYVLKGIPTA